MTSASVAGMVPQPLHWNRPPQSPVWQWPAPALLKTQPVRPQNRVFRLFGVVMVTLWPAGSTQPVAASGEVALGAAATQIVCDILLTNVTRRWPAAPAGGGEAEAAGSVGEAAARGWPCARRGVARRGLADGGGGAGGLAAAGAGRGDGRGGRGRGGPLARWRSPVPWPGPARPPRRCPGPRSPR